MQPDSPYSLVVVKNEHIKKSATGFPKSKAGAVVVKVFVLMPLIRRDGG